MKISVRFFLNLCTASALSVLCTTFTACTTTQATQPWKSVALNELAIYAQSQKTTGLLIIQDRRIILEHNWPLSQSDADKRFAANWAHPEKDRYGALQEDVASAQKSFIALLTAVAVDKGLLDVHRSVSSYIGAGWSKATPAQEGAITVLHLLEMTSGLTDPLAFEAPAGTRFYYNTPAYAMLKPILEATSKKSLDVISREWLTEPAGLSDTLWRRRPASFGDVGNPTGLYTTPRDMAVIGQLLLDQGVAANGKRVISQAQLSAMLARTNTNPAYGRLWWLNGSSYALRFANQRQETALVPAAPTDAIVALGALDRKIYAVPSRKLIVVRTGQAAIDKDFDQQLWLRLNKASN